jgi:ABC-2 type transport system ATP-binding protein
VTTAPAAEAVIEVRGLVKDFGLVKAVQGLDFTVVPGRITGFLGPNGAGKTTTLRILLGLVLPTSGTATIAGRPYSQFPDPLRQVGAVLEATSFHTARRARDHLRMMTLAAGIDHGRVDEVLELVGLSASARRRVGGFSLGMRQRLELAGAMLGDPKVLILDEPANGLDPQGIAWLRTFLRHLAGQGRTVLVSSHLLAEMAQTVDDVVIIADGQVRAACPLSELGLAGSSMRVRSPEVLRLVEVVGRAGLSTRQVTEDTVEVDGVTPEVLGPILATNQVVVYELTTLSDNLEALFLSLTGAPGQVPPGSVHQPAEPIGPQAP